MLCGVSWRGRPVVRPTAVTYSPGRCHHGNPDQPVAPSGPWSPRTDLGVWTGWACLNWAPWVPLGGLPREGLTRRRPWVRVPTPAWPERVPPALSQHSPVMSIPAPSPVVLDTSSPASLLPLWLQLLSPSQAPPGLPQDPALGPLPH